MRAGEAVAVGLVSLGLVVARPRGLNEGVAALLGAALVLILGLVPPIEALRQDASNWDVFCFFSGMMAIAALADQSGVFDVVAYRAARLARNRVAFLYLAMLLLGALVSIFFANDSAALVLTPIVYALVVRLALDPLPFVFATTFIADTASVGLPVSNPLNVILADGFHLSLGSYVGHLWLPAVLVIAVNVSVFLVMFRRNIGGRYGDMPEPERRLGLPSTLVLLVCLALAYLTASAVRFPLGVVAVVGATALSLNLLRLRSFDLPRLAREMSWPIFGFLAGMLVIVQALHDAGVTEALGIALIQAAGSSHLAAIAVSIVGSALGANLINNLPMALLMQSTIQPLHAGPALRLDLIYGTILGCDLGPNLTHLGSLATFIWLFFLRRKGLDVSTWDYFRIGVVVTPLMLAAAVFGLWITSSAA